MEQFEGFKARFEEAKQYKYRWLALYKEMYMYVTPDRDAMNELFNFRDDGKPTTLQVWDNTAVISAYQRANDLHGLLLPSDRTWGRHVMDPHYFDKDLVEKAKQVMDETNERISFYVNQSNISRVVASSNIDFTGGTGVIWVESIDDVTPLNFRSIPSLCTFIEYSTDDLLNTCWFQIKKSARQILVDFPDYNGKMLEKLRSNQEEVYTVYYGQIKDPWGRFLIYAVLEDDQTHPLFQIEREYQQIIIYRDKVRPGECEGRGIGMDLLPTIRDLNRIVEYHRKSLSTKAWPPMFYDAMSMLNPYAIRQWAGAQIPFMPGQGKPIEFLETPSFPEVKEDIRDLRDIIKVGFQVDPLGEIASPVKSATEISIRENRAQRTSSTDISRLINELPKQIYDVSAKILNTRGLLIKKRNVIPGFNPKYLKFVYTSPLTDLQNQEDVDNFVKCNQIKQQYYGEGAVIASSNVIEVNKFLAEKFRLPAKLSASDQEIQQRLAAMTQQHLAAQQPLPQSSTTASNVKLPEAQGVNV